MEEVVAIPAMRADALARAPVRVVAFGKPYALFRDANGRAAAVDDKCPHRFAPLSAGRVRDDGRVACPYHGWNFDASGRGRSPSQPELRGCDVPAYDIVEASGYLWLAARGHGRDAKVDRERAPVHEEIVAGSPGAALRAVAAEPWRFSVRARGEAADAGLSVTVGDDAIHFVPERDGFTRVVVLSRRPPSIVDRLVRKRAREPLRVAADLATKLDAIAAPAAATPAPRDGWSGFRAFVVTRAYTDGAGTRSIHLAPKDGAPLPPFRPGQHLTFRLEVPGRAKPVVRCYSLSDAHRPTEYRVTIKREEHGVASRFLHEIDEGAEVALKAPGGHFALDMAARTPVVLIAGGVGVTPMLAMMNAIVEAHEREVWLFYGVRRAVEFVQREHLHRIAATHPNVRVRLYVSGEAPCEGAEGGRIDFARVVREAPPDADHYVCGPAALMHAAVAALEAAGVPDDRIHFESFGPASVRRASAKRAAANGVPPQVTFARTGVTLPWDPAASSLLTFARDNGVDVDAGCCLGSCTTCTTKLVSGDVARVSEPGEPIPAGACLPCISVPTSDVTLDL